MAVNIYKARKFKGAGGELYRSIQKQKNQFQGIWIVSPEGKVLSGYGESSHVVITNGDVDNAKTEAAWVKVIGKTITDALKVCGKVTPRSVQHFESLPNRGVGVRPDKSVNLALYGRYIAYKPLRSDADNHVRIDSLSLTAQQWAGLAPPKVEAGTEWKVPDGVARQFSRVLCPSSDSDGWPLAKEVTRVQFTGRVDKIENGMAFLSYRGDIAGVHVAIGQNASGLKADEPKPRYGGEAKLTGLALYDTTRREMKALTFVFEGTYRYRMPADARSMAVVVEWQHAPVSP